MVRALLLCLAALLVVPSAARAEDRAGVVAVLPLVPSDEELEIYGQPVADAVVSRLRKSLEVPVERVSLSEPPAHAMLVVDGRIFRVKKGRVRLEASVRDPSRGRAVGRVSTASQPLTEVDALAAELAEELAEVLRRAAPDAARAERAGERRLPSTVVRVGDDKEGRPRTTDAKKIGAAAGPGPLLVLEARGGRDLSAIDVGAVATPAAYRLAERLGRQAAAPSEKLASRISVSREELQAWLRRGEASHALVTELRSVQFLWRQAVLTARAEVRIVLVGESGRPLYDKTVETGTLVGSRGDRFPALVRFVADQAADMVYPELRRLLEP